MQENFGVELSQEVDKGKEFLLKNKRILSVENKIKDHTCFMF